jgi:predicted DNA-binding ribbon-helix-helix protein
MMTRMDEYKPISARIKKASIEALEKMAAEREITLTQLLREIIRDYLIAKGKTK